MTPSLKLCACTYAVLTIKATRKIADILLKRKGSEIFSAHCTAQTKICQLLAFKVIVAAKRIRFFIVLNHTVFLTIEKHCY